MCETAHRSLESIEQTLTLKFSFVSHGSNYDNVHIPSVTLLAMCTENKEGKVYCKSREYSTKKLIKRAIGTWASPHRH